MNLSYAEQARYGIARILFGEKINSLLSEALFQLSKTTEGANKLAIYHQVLQGCVEGENYESVARAIVAATVVDSHRSHEWLKEIKVCLTPLHLRKEATEDFILGVVLGLFRAVVWLDQEWRAETEFDKQFHEVVIRIVLSQEKVIRDITLKPNDKQDGKYYSTYRGRLSETIKSYVRGTDFMRPYRLVSVQRIFEGVYDELEQTKEESLTVLGALILDEIAYAQFGQLSSQGRVYAFASLFRDLLDFSKHQKS